MIEVKHIDNFVKIGITREDDPFYYKCIHLYPEEAQELHKLLGEKLNIKN